MAYYLSLLWPVLSLPSVLQSTPRPTRSKLALGQTSKLFGETRTATATPRYSARMYWALSNIDDRSSVLLSFWTGSVQPSAVNVTSETRYDIWLSNPWLLQHAHDYWSYGTIDKWCSPMFNGFSAISSWGKVRGTAVDSPKTQFHCCCCSCCWLLVVVLPHTLLRGL